MSNRNKIKIDAKEVLEYLNQLGYTNITAHLLKDFLTGRYEVKLSVLYI